MSSPSRLLLLSSVFAATALVVGSGIRLAQASRAIEPPPVTAEGEGQGGPASHRVRRLGLEVRLASALDRGRWEEAVELAEELRRHDPISSQARSAIRRAKEELAARERFLEGVEKLDRGKEEAALDAFFSVAPGTESHQRARLEATKVAARVSKRARGDCLGLQKEGRHREALASCRRHLDLVCATRVDPDILERVRWLERRIGGEAWRCPANLDAWWGEGASSRGAVVGDDSLGPRLEAMVRQWAEGGSGERAIADVARLAEAGDARAGELLEALRASENHQREGIAHLLEDRLFEAEASLRIAARAEERLLQGRRSARLQAAFRDLGRRLLREGRRLEGQRRWSESFDSLLRASAADPSDPDILRALWGLERRVEDLALEESDCRSIQEGLSVVPSESPARGRLERALERCAGETSGSTR